MNLFEKRKRLNKKGVGMMDLVFYGIMFVVFTVALSFGATIVNDLRATQTADSHAYNVSTYGLTALITMTKQAPTLALVLIASVIIGVLVASFLYGMKKGD